MTERIKLNEDERYSYFVRTRHRKKLLVVIVSLVLIMSLLTVRVGYIMTVRAEYYSVRATELHERERAIKAMRGRILDTNGVVLADNTTVCTISVIHSQIDKPEEVIKMLCDNLDKDTGDIIRKAGLNGVKVDEDYKRYYPYDTLASKVLGFTGSDNQGIVGLEAKYDVYLAGNNGRILTLTDAWGTEIKNAKEGRLEPQRGQDLYISIDMNIQSYAQQLAYTTLAKKNA